MLLPIPLNILRTYFLDIFPDEIILSPSRLDIIIKIQQLKNGRLDINPFLSY
jgi:hypothetical protein